MNYLTSGRTVFQQRSVILPFMETEGPLPCSQKPSTILSSEPYESGSYLHIQFNINLIFMRISVIWFILLSANLFERKSVPMLAVCPVIFIIKHLVMQPKIIPRDMNSLHVRHIRSDNVLTFRF